MAVSGSGTGKRTAGEPLTGARETEIEGYRPEQSFSDAISARFHDVRGDEDECVRFLRELAGDRRVLELAIGTGRIALPLTAAGVRVDGIDFSPEMIARLREKPGGEALDVTLGDFADVEVGDSYGLVVIVWNAFFNLLTQSDQKRCFVNVARHLKSDGSFLIEAFTPSVFHRLTDNQQVEVEEIGTDRVRIGVLRHDPAEQRIEQNHVTLTENGLRFDPVVQRYAWPAELDLMAEMAGLTLKARWAGWQREPFDHTSNRHVSVYGFKGNEKHVA